MIRTLCLAFAIAIGLSGSALATHDQKGFDSPDDAVNALVSAVRTGDRKAMLEILGSAGRPFVSSGDDVEDRKGFQDFAAAYDKAHRLEGAEAGWSSFA